MAKKAESTIFRMSHGFFKDELIPYSFVHPELTAKQLENFNSLGLDIDSLYVNPRNFIYPNVYLGKGFKSNILIVDNLFDSSKDEIMNCNEFTDIKCMCAKQFLFQREKFNAAIEEKNWERALRILDKPFLADSFLEIHNKIPDNDIREIFIEMYSRLEYGYEKLSPVLHDVLNNRTNMTVDEEDAFNAAIDKFDSMEIKNGKEYVRIFRGETSKSNKVSQAFSWSLNYDTAKYFSNRFDSVGRVYEALILKEKILAYLNNRSEYEVIVNFKDIQLIP